MTGALPDLISDEELLARFVMSRRWIRGDGTIRAEAFYPPSDLNLSVTRRSGLTISALWQRGLSVAEMRSKALVGRADVSARAVRQVTLDAVAHPLTENAEHAHVVGWPVEKPQQKMLALELAGAATFEPATRAT